MRGALLHPTMAMAHWTPLRLLTVLLWCCVLTAVNADFNMTLDDSDLSIVYNPPSSWTHSDPDPLDYGGEHMSTEDPTATATLTFTGTAIYYMSPLWPYRVNTLITLDELPPILVSLRDRSQPEVENSPETAESQVVWSSVGLDNVEHTLTVSVGVGENLAIVDGLLYTVSESTAPTSTDTSTATDTDTPTDTSPILIPTSSSSSSLLPTPTAVSASATSSKPAGLSTAIGIVCALFGLLGLCALLWWWRRRRRRQRERAESMADLPLPPEMDEAAGGGRPMWRTRSARYRDIAAHLGDPAAPPVPARGANGNNGRRVPPPPPHRKPPPVLKKPLTTIPEVSSGLASGAVLTARDVEGDDAPFAPGHSPAWADVRLVAPPAGRGGQESGREEDPWTIREQ
ncbi:hypothetical protein BJ912DRAFT_970385 [Pholiota molesta]|nr:hypothetical protein BJ912DRAFT_970385 [Pholiota molesta]